jgi:hypothetical protein
VSDASVLSPNKGWHACKSRRHERWGLILDICLLNMEVEHKHCMITIDLFQPVGTVHVVISSIRGGRVAAVLSMHNCHSFPRCESCKV